ncbi:MAG: lipoyl(octanoyl) transferase LipB [Bdellovibrionaceae bacterium]|nr:lipoyl(octanoyl) transferase LipB [Pseudobdellovibrionaceae bacterium]
MTAFTEIIEPGPSERDLDFQDWGLIEYSQALLKMQETLEQVIAGHTAGTLIFCSHPPVVTLGRATQAGDVFGWSGPLLEVSRGGRATYHGPSQVVVYPILNLKEPRKGRGPQEIAGYLRALEDGIVEALREFGIDSTGRSRHKKSETSHETDETGVWCGSRKVASLGISVKKWVTSHGAAINLQQDPQAFVGMNPCGFQTNIMASVEELLGAPVDRSHFQDTLKAILLKRL